MAHIVIAFYNGIPEEKGIPSFYESFISGLEKYGNKLLLFSHKTFVGNFGKPNEEIQQQIKEFNPDLVILFNNAFFVLSDIVSCPIIVYEVDSPAFYSNKKELISNKERYIYFVANDSNAKKISEWDISSKKIFNIPFFTEIQAESKKIEENISFIGSMFMGSSDETCLNKFIMSNPSHEEKILYKKYLLELCENVTSTEAQLIDKMNIYSKKIIENVNNPQLLNMLSDERRIEVLSKISSLGMRIFGTSNWGKYYYVHSDLNLCFENRIVYSLQDNQDIYNSSKIGISIAHVQAREAFPWRVMDIMASNACLVTDKHSNFDKYFPNIPIQMYDNAQEAKNLCEYLISHEDERIQIVRECQNCINKKYRFSNIIKIIEQIIDVKLS